MASDLDELLEMADSVVVMFDGRIVGRWDGADVDREHIGRSDGGLMTAELTLDGRW